MKKWYRVCVPYANYRRGDFICPEGLNRESLQQRGWITRQPVYVGARKPSIAEVAQYGVPPVASIWPVVNAAPEPEPEPAPAVEAEAELDNEPRRRGRPRKGW
jgi:hypothetical protein